ncbi:YajQ family cyclic di-GMP-binding protein [Gammaproteobacteria bacterium]|jgi:cyclic-di-GMP-binding protein|nr:YajQ family cyclic di-GMP-binding protein [Gammaproteobacteria bacterium]
MPTFDIVSEVDMHEMSNAVDQASREIGTRFDFKGVPASFELSDNVVVLTAEVDFQIQQMMDILQSKMVKRGLDISSLKSADIENVGQRAIMKVAVQQGIEADIARKIVKKVKEQKMKVQVAIQGEKLRVTGKKRDDLQGVIAMLKDENYGLPLQYNNFRD